MMLHFICLISVLIRSECTSISRLRPGYIARFATNQCLPRSHRKNVICQQMRNNRAVHSATTPTKQKSPEVYISDAGRASMEDLSQSTWMNARLEFDENENRFDCVQLHNDNVGSTSSPDSSPDSINQWVYAVPISGLLIE